MSAHMLHLHCFHSVSQEHGYLHMSLLHPKGNMQAAVPEPANSLHIDNFLLPDASCEAHHPLWTQQHPGRLLRRIQE